MIHSTGPAKKKSIHICRYQEGCSNKKEGKCSFLHLEHKFLDGLKPPYRLCFDWPNCKRERCLYVHWPEGEHQQGEAEEPKKSDESVVEADN